MNDHLTKPIDPDELFSALTKWIKPGARDVPEERRDLGMPAEESKVLLPSELPGIDLSSGLSRVGGNQRLYVKLLSQFRSGHRDAAQEIGAAFRSGDMDTAGRLAHTVKGVSGNLGAEGLYRVSAALEKAIKEGRENIDHPLAGFSAHLKTVMEGIRALEGGLSSRQAPEMPRAETEVDKETVKALLQEIERLLESDLTEAMARLETLRQHLAHSPAHEEFKRLEKQVENFDTDGALKSVEDIARAMDIAI
jgi:HPt (histidine-containing phosphotransfer) domain-containing protein